MRGLRAPTAGCALNTLRVAYIISGWSSASRKQGRVTGLGRASTRVTTSSTVCGDVGVPAGATQRLSLASAFVVLPQPDKPVTTVSATVATDSERANFA